MLRRTEQETGTNKTFWAETSFSPIQERLQPTHFIRDKTVVRNTATLMRSGLCTWCACGYKEISEEQQTACSTQAA